jgi:hypothetical protein
MKPPGNCILRTFLVASGKRDVVKYPSGSQFVYDLPITLTNVVGVAIRDYKFGPETLVNQNNRTLSVSRDGASLATVSIDAGNYANSITDLLTALNTAFTADQLTFVVDGGTGRVQVTFTAGTATTTMRVVFNPLLRILGFTSDITLNASGSLIAPNAYDVWNLSDMVLRIQNVETILSNDAITNRATAILFNTPSGMVSKQCLDHYTPLLQTQQRLQSLKIQLLNMEGDLYDTVYNEAMFMLEFYCDV